MTTPSNMVPAETIPGVRVVELKAFGDDRGSFRETFRQSWFPDLPAMIQGNCSHSQAGVLRGLHFHTKQADYWFVPHGKVLAILGDLRPGSPTHKQIAFVEMGDGAERGLYIPPGVAHGYYASTAGTMTYLVDQYYDNSDEFGVAWDDPELAIPWPFEGAPLLSGRDVENPKLSEIAASDLVAFTA